MAQKIIGVTDLQRRFKAVIDEVREDRVPFVLTRGSRPEAVILPYDEYVRLERLDEKEVVYRFDRLLERMRERNAAIPESEVADDVRQARDEARSR
ncbi:MAG: type II toxin-antitoxin system Phd/YefM family antitoxin [Acidobacteriota bacterium]|jgi:prevent-host-death family protein